MDAITFVLSSQVFFSLVLPCLVLSCLVWKHAGHAKNTVFYDMKRMSRFSLALLLSGLVLSCLVLSLRRLGAQKQPKMLKKSIKKQQKKRGEN